MTLPEAQTLTVCPVTAALQFIHHDALRVIGIYDEGFKMGWEDVDYCLRTFLAGRSCVYNPFVRAWHAESIFRSKPSPKLAEWQRVSIARLTGLYARTNFAMMVPER